MSDRITTHDEAYAVTATKGAGAMARSVVQLLPADGTTTGPVTYGADIRIAANPHICNKPLFLMSSPLSPMAFARFSRN